MNTNTQNVGGQEHYQNYDYNDSYQQDYEFQSKNFNLLEITTALLVLLSLLGVLVWGFFSQSTKNRDRQREIDIQNIIKAVNSFYTNSSTIPSRKSYPIAECSERLNEADFEYTLKQYLTGAKKQIDTHQYVKPQDFPSDRWGVYSTSVQNRRVALRDCPKLFSSIQTIDSNIYPDGTKSCNFSSRNSGFLKCYLYTSSNSGDKYQVAYYSEDRGAFVVYSKFRDDNMVVEVISL
jgi:type II secretory pathway pseudopilin PulG